MQRLDKILSEAGVASRKDLRTIIRAGRVCVNGVCVTKENEKFDEKTAQITLDGEVIEKMRSVLLMLHKPAGYVTSTDEHDGKTVMQLIPERYRAMGVCPVGRLDKQTEGLLLFTNDGDLAHKLISPRSGVWKRYYAEHEGVAGEEDCAAFAAGLELGDGTKCLPARLIPQGKGKSIVEVQEGKYHQVRRMLASRGMSVSYLKRISEGGLELGALEKGEILELDMTEAAKLCGISL